MQRRNQNQLELSDDDETNSLDGRNYISTDHSMLDDERVDVRRPFREYYRGSGIHYPYSDLEPAIVSKQPFPDMYDEPPETMHVTVITLGGSSFSKVDLFGPENGLLSLFTDTYIGDSSKMLLSTQNKILKVYDTWRWEYFVVNRRFKAALYGDRADFALPFLRPDSDDYDELNEDQQFRKGVTQSESIKFELSIIEDLAKGYDETQTSIRKRVPLKRVKQIHNHFVKYNKPPSDSKRKYFGPSKKELLAMIQSSHGSKERGGIWGALVKKVKADYPSLANLSSLTLHKHIKDDYGLKKVRPLPRLAKYDHIESLKIWIALTSWSLLHIHHGYQHTRFIYYSVHSFNSKATTVVYGDDTYPLRPISTMSIPFVAYLQILYDPKMGCYAINIQNKPITSIQHHNFLSKTIRNYKREYVIDDIVLVLENDKQLRNPSLSALFEKLGVAVVFDISKKLSIMPNYDFYLKILRVALKETILKFDDFVVVVTGWLSRNRYKFYWLYRRLFDRLLSELHKYRQLLSGDGYSGKIKLIGFGPRYGQGRRDYLNHSSGLYITLPVADVPPSLPNQHELVPQIIGGQVNDIN